MEVAELPNAVCRVQHEIRRERVVQFLGIMPDQHPARQLRSIDLVLKRLELNFVFVGVASHLWGILAIPGRILPLP